MTVIDAEPKAVNVIPAGAIAGPVRPLLADGMTGRILAGFDRSCYVETDDERLFALLAPSLGRGAFAVTTAADFPSFGEIPAGTLACVQSHTLRVGALAIDLRPAAVWDPTLPRVPGSAEKGMQAVEAFLHEMAPEEGLARVLSDDGTDALVSRARSALKDLRVALSQGDGGGLAAASASLAGLGPGLTPSGDDLLAGLMLALRQWPSAAGSLGAERACALIAHTAAPRTNRISRAYLEAAQRAHASQAWHQLIEELTDPSGATRAAGAIVQAGETSGADMLAGFLFGWTLSRDLRLGITDQTVRRRILRSS